MIWKGLPLVIFGSGGISKEVYSLIKDINRANNQQVFDFIGFIGSNKSEVGNEIINGYKVVSFDEDIEDFTSNHPIIGMVIPIGNPEIKRLIYNKVKNIANAVFPNIIHPSVYFNDKNLEIGKGNIVADGVILTCDIKIGDFNLFNINSTVGHDVEIGNFNVINPLVAISGNVHLKDCCLIGTGVQVLQGLNIGSYSTVGAGAVVVKNVESNTTVVGIPAKPIGK
ncbi:MAG: acetyltransferase [Clostridia bacterium]|nr:acetyltransferase [Clostridia bacterium]NCC55336.1 acetyltransferase [Erysipelotrichia bacterium]